MEKETLKVDPKSTTARWLRQGYIKITGKTQLKALKVGDHFIKNGELCFINVKGSCYISWYNVIMQEHRTSNTTQQVDIVEFNRKAINGGAY